MIFIDKIFEEKRLIITLSYVRRTKSLFFSSWNILLPVLVVCLFVLSLHKKWNLPLQISLVNVTKSAVSCGFGHNY